MELHLVNVTLPLADDGRLYELKASGGVWISIEPQSGGEANDRYAVQQAAASEEAEEKRPIRLTELQNPTESRGPIDLEGRMLLPGFVDAHMHLDKATSLAQVGNRSGTLGEAIVNYGARVASFSKAEIKMRIVSTALMALAKGTTHIRTHLDFHIHRGRDVAFRTVEAALEAREELRGKVDVQLFPMCPFDRLNGPAMEAAEELLKLGMDGLGGAPHLGNEQQKEIGLLFGLASKYGVPIDLHADESDDPARRSIIPIAERTIEYGYRGKVTAGHLCSLASMPEEDAARIIELMETAGISAVTLPAANLYLQGREDRGPFRRGITRVKELMAGGIPVSVASDNIQDPFHPLGRGDLVQMAVLASYAAHLAGPADLRMLLRMITDIPARTIGLADYGIKPGNPASFVVVDAVCAEELFTNESPSRWVASHGRWVSSSIVKSWTASDRAASESALPG